MTSESEGPVDAGLGTVGVDYGDVATARESAKKGVGTKSKALSVCVGGHVPYENMRLIEKTVKRWYTWSSRRQGMFRGG